MARRLFWGGRGKGAERNRGSWLTTENSQLSICAMMLNSEREGERERVKSIRDLKVALDTTHDGGVRVLWPY